MYIKIVNLPFLLIFNGHLLSFKWLLHPKNRIVFRDINLAFTQKKTCILGKKTSFIETTLINDITTFQIPFLQRFVLQTSVTVVAAQFSRQFSKFFRVIDTLISSKNNDSELKNLLRDAHPVKRLNVDK